MHSDCAMISPRLHTDRKMLGHMVLRAAAWPCSVTFEPMLTTESAIEQFFGQVKHVTGSCGSVTTCNSIAAAQLVHMRQSRKPLQACFFCDVFL